MKPPFGLSDHASSFLERIPRIVGKEPGFICSPRYRLSIGHEILENYEGDHYSFVFASPIDWREERGATRFLIGCRGFWVTPDLLGKLTGRTLEVIELDVGQGNHVGKMRQFLIALPLGVSTPNKYRAEQEAAGQPATRPKSK